MVTLVLCLVLVVVASLFLLAPIKTQIAHAAVLIQRAITDASFSSTIESHIPPALWTWFKSQLEADRILTLLQSENTVQTISTALSHIAPGAFSIVSGTLKGLLWLLGLTMVFIYLFFMLLDFDRLRTDLSNLIPVTYREEVFSFLGKFDFYMSGYFRAQALVSLCLGVIFAIGFSLIGLPLGIVFGLSVGLMTMVPYLQLASLPFAASLALLQSVDHGVPFWQVIGFVLLVYIVAQIIQDLILVPRILGNFSGLSPVMILLSLSIWGKLLGMFGLIVAIPFTCLALAYYQRLLAHHKP
jgi:predicted PurR-regulated permease PerM